MSLITGNPESLPIPRVILAHPGLTQNSVQAARALDESGTLLYYETGLTWSSGSLNGLLELLPGGLRHYIQRELKRRIRPGISSNHIKSHIILDLVYSAASRWIPNQGITEALLRWRNRRFESLVALGVRKHQPSAVYCYDGSATQIFKASRKLSIYRILEQAIGFRKTGMEIMLEENNRYPEWADTIGSKPPENWWIDLALEEIRNADLLLAPSNFVRESLQSAGAPVSKIHVLPYGVDSQRFQPKTQPRDSAPFRVLFVGQISHRKGVHYLLEAWRRLNLSGAELVLVGRLIGDRRGMAAYAGWYRHLDSVPYTEMPSQFQQADVFAFPSLYEGSALVTYEAMASGLPIITTPNSGSVVRDGMDGFIVPIRNMEALMDRIMRLYQNRDLRIQMGKSARERAVEYDWSQYRKRLGEIVRAIGTPAEALPA